MKVLIVGSGGFLGRHFLKLIQDKGIEAVGVSSSDGTGGINPDTGVLSDEFSFPTGTDAVVYLAQSPYYKKIPEMLPHVLNVNVVSAVRMAELARRNKINRFIYASTGNVYAPSFEPLTETSPLQRDDCYSLSKLQAEEALSFYRNAMNITVIRPFGIYGPGQTDKLIPNLLRSLMDNKTIFIEKNPYNTNDLDGLRISLCYINNVIDMLFKLLVCEGPDYLNLAGNKPLSMRQIVALMADSLGKEAELKISDRSRRFNLIADISLLKKTLNPEFTEPQAGLRETVNSAIDEQERVHK